MNADETIEVEDRIYVNPNVSMGEQDQFIDKFRELQQANQEQINQDTYALGSQVSSNQGGLTGAEGLWDAQYRQAQVNSAIQGLRQTNQLTALETAMQNEQNLLANQLAQAKRAYYRAQHERAKADRDGTNKPKDPTTPDQPYEGVNLDVIPEGTAVGSLVGGWPGTTTVAGPATVVDPSKPSANVFVDEEEGYAGYGTSNTGSHTVTRNPEGVGFWESLGNAVVGLPGLLLGLAGTSEKVKQ